jgi:hypothetical protein
VVPISFCASVHAFSRTEFGNVVLLMNLVLHGIILLRTRCHTSLNVQSDHIVAYFKTVRLNRPTCLEILAEFMTVSAIRNVRSTATII